MAMTTNVTNMAMLTQLILVNHDDALISSHDLSCHLKEGSSTLSNTALFGIIEAGLFNSPVNLLRRPEKTGIRMSACYLQHSSCLAQHKGREESIYTA